MVSLSPDIILWPIIMTLSSWPIIKISIRTFSRWIASGAEVTKSEKIQTHITPPFRIISLFLSILYILALLKVFRTVPTYMSPVALFSTFYLLSHFFSSGFGMTPIMYFIQIPGEFKENCTFNQPIKCDLTVQCHLIHAFCIFGNSRSIYLKMKWICSVLIRHEADIEQDEFSTCPFSEVKQLI